MWWWGDLDVTKVFEGSEETETVGGGKVPARDASRRSYTFVSSRETSGMNDPVQCLCNQSGEHEQDVRPDCAP